MPAVPDAVIREYHEAFFACKQKQAAAVARDEMLSLPRDVREARAALECIVEAERLRDATIALEVVKAEIEERWVASHEDLAILRRGTMS